MRENTRKQDWKDAQEYFETFTEADLKPMHDWLAEYTKPLVINQYERLFTFFCNWAEKSPKQLVTDFDNKTAKGQILKYQAFLAERYAQNTARTMTQVVRAFYTSQCESVRGLKRKILRTQLPTEEHSFSIEDLRAMHAIANTLDKAVLSVACSLGYHASAFLSLNRKQIEQFVKRAKAQKKDFASWYGQRSKTMAYRLSILTPIALHNLEKHLRKTRGQESKRLFDLSERTLNNRMKALVVESGIVTTGKVSFKAFRKWLMQALNDCRLTEFETKLILGKSIGTADQTYLQTLQRSAFEKYRKAYVQHLSLSQQVNGNAKYNQAIDLAVKIVEAFDNFRDYAKQQGLMKKVTPELEQQFKDLTEYAQIMQKKNGEKPHEENDNQEES